MKLSLRLSQRRPLDRSTAWACVLANQFALPGTGSLAAGRRAGYGQLALGALGILPTLAFTLRALMALIHFQRATGSFASIEELIEYAQIHLRQWPQSWGLYFWIGAPGVALFLVAWFWALASSIGIIHEASRRTKA